MEEIKVSDIIWKWLESEHFVIVNFYFRFNQFITDIFNSIEDQEA